MIDFQNQSLNIDELPKFENADRHPVDQAYLKILRLLFGFWLVFLFGGLTILELLIDLPQLAFYPVLAFFVVFFTLSIIETEKGFPRRQFGIRERDIIFQSGYFVFNQTILPYKRIQHVEVKQGPLFKIFDLYTLKVFTAGSSAGDLSIAGLNKNDADKLKAQILKAAGIDNY